MRHQSTCGTCKNDLLVPRTRSSHDTAASPIANFGIGTLAEVSGTAGQMRESRNRIAVSPSPREAGNGWVLDAVFPNGKQAAIAGFTTESEANNWLGSAGHVAWLRDTRTPCCSRSAAAIFAWLGSYAIVLSDVATEFCEWIRQRFRAIEALRIGYRRISATSVQLHASPWLCVASDLARRMSKRWRAGQSGSSFRHRTAYRRLLAGAAALLILVAVLAILIVVLVTLGRGERPTRLASGPTQFTADSPVVPSHPSEATAASDPIALLIDRMSTSEIATELPTEATGERPSPQSGGDQIPPFDIHAATPRPDSRRAAPPAIVGVWAPETGSCSARNREGVLTAIINERGARAGKTSCVFKEQRWTERDWRILANCTNGHERWTSKVRLMVKGDRLVWTSKRGTQAYTRCKSNI